MVNRNLGIRRSYINEATRVAKEILSRKLQTIVFANSRLHTEVILTYLQQANGSRLRPDPRFGLFAQSQGTVTGTVIDPSGAVVSHARVTGTNQATGVSQSVSTANDGRFTIVAPPGEYRVNVEVSGFKTITESGITVQPTQEAHLRIVLLLGSGESILGQIKIKVRDKLGRVVPAATVAVQTAGSGEDSGITDEKGEYIYSAAAPGDYSIRAEAPGGKRAEKSFRLTSVVTFRLAWRSAPV